MTAACRAKIPGMAAAKNLYGHLQALGYDVGKRDIVTVSPKALKLITSPSHPLYDERINEPVPASLVDDMRSHGSNHTPILVRKDGDDLLVVAGTKRTRAGLKLLEERSDFRVQVVVVRGSDKELYLLKMSENHNREAESPMTSALKANRVLAMGATYMEIARALGRKAKSEGAAKAIVDEVLEILNLPTEAQQAVETKLAPRTAVAALSSVGSEAAVRAVDEMKKVSEARVAQGFSAKLTHSEAKTAVTAAKAGKTVDVAALPERRSMRRRGDIEKLIAKLGEEPIDGAATAAALLAWAIGDEKPMKRVAGLSALVRAALS